MAMGWPLQGRDREVAAAARLLDGGRRGVLLVGEAGVGKSRLAVELAERRAAAGHHVARLAGTSSASALPLAAVAPLLPADPADAGLPALVLLRQALAGAAEGRPVTLVVDDAHLIDDASAVLVHQLVVGGEVAFLGTQRSGTVAPDAIARLWWDQLVERVEVQPLDRAATEALGADITGHALTAEQAERLWELSEGNPLYVRELLAEGDIALLPGADGQTEVASRLAELVDRRLAGLDAEAREALRHIAFGEPLGPGELDRVLSSSALVTLERAGLVVAEEDGRRLQIRVAHPLYSEVLRGGTEPEGRRAVLYRLAEALQATGARRRGDRVRLATWSVDSGLDIPADDLAAAARVARFSWDLDLARRLAEEAFAREPTFAHGEVLADALYETGDTEAILAHLDRWWDLAADDAQRAHVCCARAPGEFWRAGDAEATFAVLDRADALAPSEWRDEARGVRATLLAFAGRATEAWKVAEPLLATPPSRANVQAALAAGQALRSLGRPSAAVEVLDAALAVYEGLGEQALLISHRVLGAARGAALIDVGRLVDAEAQLAETVRLSREAGELGGVGVASLAEGWLRLQQGRIADAATCFDTSARSQEIARHHGMRRWAVASLALVRAMGGDVPGARKALADVDERAHPAQVFEQAVHRARAWLAWRDGDEAGAHRVLREAAVELRGRGDVNGMVFCLHDLARLGRAEEAAAELASVEVDGELLPLVCRHVAALARGDLDELGAVADGFAGTGAWLLAAEVASAADEAGRRGGDARAAAAWARRAEEWRSRCDALPAVGTAPASAAVPLTRREREVALLVAEGLSSREVAERLYVGTRTVESHLARAYAKLGIRSRSELAELLAAGA